MRLKLVSSEKGLDFDDVLIVPQRSQNQSRDNINLERQFKSKHSGVLFSCVPIIASNMNATGTINMAKSLSKHKIMTALHKYYKAEELNEIILYTQYVFLTIGEDKNAIKQLLQIINDPSDKFINSAMINIDVANGYRSSFVDFVKDIRDHFPNEIIMAGNVCTPEMVQELIMSGADIVKIGIGPGSVCETRKITGVGYPQLSAISECANAAHNLKGFICADGGCRIPADICKAFCAGADFVMLGGMLAGTDECDGEWKKEYIPGYFDSWTPQLSTKLRIVKKSLRFYGMSSTEAMKNNGGLEKEYRTSEGKCIEVPYKGSVDNIVKEIMGGLRSCGTYIGASEIKHFSKHANFVRIK